MKRLLQGLLGQLTLFHQKQLPDQKWADKIESLFPFLPEASIDYVKGLWEAQPFYFKAAQPRKRVMGDFRPAKMGVGLITVNNNLKPKHFLIVLLHEIAHHQVHLKYPTSLAKRRAGVTSHGEEWKNTFSQLLKPLLHLNIYEADELEQLKDLIKHPTATHSKQVAFMYQLMGQELLGFDPNSPAINTLLPNTLFEFKGIVYKVKNKRRTRILAIRLKDGVEFSFRGEIPVQVINNQ